ncbi:MAG TPA: FtsK/SpoIIIE domain-containing protein [Myxococcales bacterium]|nr:FtsK/SpoIIIE domain-containing protein [Myxococcales bacterium]
MIARFSVTELAIAARCPRQMLLAREGYRVVDGDGGIGQTAHAALAGFVTRGASHPLVQESLSRTPLDESLLLTAVVEGLYREFFDRAPGVAPAVASQDLVRLGRIVFDLSSLLGELLLRARRSGLTGTEAFTRAFEASERRVELDLNGVEVRGALDLLCRDLERKRAYVFDLKTGLADLAAEEQVRLYALALKRSGEGFSPALAYVSGETIEVKVVAPLDQHGERQLASRARDLAGMADGKMTPPAAPDLETCRTCPVQKPCWTRWGRTLRVGEIETLPPPAAGEIAEEALKLEKSLRAHRVHLDRIDPALAVVGPNVVRFKLALREGEAIARVEKSARDVQRDMGWPVPPLVCNDGKHVALDAPRRDREVLPWRAASLGDLSGLEVPVGLSLNRELLKLDLATAPHLLVAGTTSSGKSVFLKGLILALLRLPPEECRIVIVDPKMVDFTSFRSPPLWQPVVTDPDDAVALLQSLVDVEMPARTQKLIDAGVPQRTDLPRGSMPALVVVIDEFADLLASFTDRDLRTQFIGSVQRLLQRARAVGIHLVIATQRPSVDAVPGALKANLPVRIAFKLPSSHDSVTVLDESGAENLLGRGDLLLKREGSMTRAQAFNVAPQDLQDELTRGPA